MKASSTVAIIMQNAFLRFMKLIIAFLLIILAFCNCSNSSPYEVINVTEGTGKKQGFIDFTLSGNKIWAITGNSSLITFDLQNEHKSKVSLDEGVKIIALAKDKNGSIVFADTKNRFGRNEAGHWSFTNAYKSRIKEIFYTKRNDEYLLTDTGILNVKQNKSYLPDSSLNHQLRLPYAFRAYACTYIDSQDNIWLGYNHGEWGGDIYIFSTVENRFIAPKLKGFEIELSPIFAFTEGPEGVYFSGGLSHLGMTSGYLGLFQNFTSKTLFQNEYSEWPRDSIKREGYYIGPINYNQWDNSLYFYTQHGFYRCASNTDISKVKNWENVLKPELLWHYSQKNATGFEMNVSKILNTGPGAFMFLTELNGIGYFNDNKLIMFQ